LGGQMFMTGKYLDESLEMPHGHFVFYNQNGNKEAEGDYHKGMKVGTWKRWNAEGAPMPDRAYQKAPEETASVKEIKNALSDLKKDELIALCLRLSKFKKENKELITYVLFEEHDEEGYLQSVKNKIDEEFNNINTSNLYFVKKNIRRIIRVVNKYIRYSGKAVVEIDLLIYVCKSINEKQIALEKSQVLKNMYQSLLKRVNKSMDTLHEDLQYEFKQELAIIMK
jgi:hypothetical protein